MCDGMVTRQHFCFRREAANDWHLVGFRKTQYDSTSLFPERFVNVTLVGFAKRIVSPVERHFPVHGTMGHLHKVWPGRCQVGAMLVVVVCQSGQ